MQGVVGFGIYFFSARVERGVTLSCVLNHQLCNQQPSCLDGQARPFHERGSQNREAVGR
jgi:hypothetical protein